MVLYNWFWCDAQWLRILCLGRIHNCWCEWTNTQLLVWVVFWHLVRVVLWLAYCEYVIVSFFCVVVSSILACCEYVMLWVCDCGLFCVGVSSIVIVSLFRQIFVDNFVPRTHRQTDRHTHNLLYSTSSLFSSPWVSTGISSNIIFVLGCFVGRP